MKKTANRHLAFEKGVKPTEMNAALFDYMISTMVCGNWSELRTIYQHLRQYRELETFKDHIRSAYNPASQKLELLLMMQGRGSEWFADWQPLVSENSNAADKEAAPVVNEILHTLT